MWTLHWTSLYLINTFAGVCVLIWVNHTGEWRCRHTCFHIRLTSRFIFASPALIRCSGLRQHETDNKQKFFLILNLRLGMRWLRLPVRLGGICNQCCALLNDKIMSGCVCVCEFQRINNPLLLVLQQFPCSCTQLEAHHTFYIWRAQPLWGCDLKSVIMNKKWMYK